MTEGKRGPSHDGDKYKEPSDGYWSRVPPPDERQKPETPAEPKERHGDWRNDEYESK